jgi:ADP-ribose pyrophosphatase YjhB (NUDIX family)
MPAIRNSARAVIVRDGAVLLQVCRDGDRVFHLLPGGTQEFGEPLDATVRREVLEETGLTIRVERLLWVSEYIERAHRPVAGDGEHALHSIFLCIPESDIPTASATVPDTYQVDVRWVPLTELPGIELVPRVVQQHLIEWHEQGGALVPTYLGSRM